MFVSLHCHRQSVHLASPSAKLRHPTRQRSFSMAAFPGVRLCRHLIAQSSSCIAGENSLNSCAGVVFIFKSYQKLMSVALLSQAQNTQLDKQGARTTVRSQYIEKKTGNTQRFTKIDRSSSNFVTAGQKTELLYISQFYSGGPTNIGNFFFKIWKLIYMMILLNQDKILDSKTNLMGRV